MVKMVFIEVTIVMKKVTLKMVEMLVMMGMANMVDLVDTVMKVILEMVGMF